jgi:DNA-directed RNA polymerase subunit RPC12/RpoP
MRTHYGVKPFICDFCSKEFNDKGNLKTHLRIHTGERPYKCSLCCKAFKTEGQLREHFGSHYKEKPFQCPYCLKYFKRKGVVKNNIIIHYQDPLFIEKKNYYKKIVDNLDNKNLLDFCYKNSTNFSTKDESQNNSPIVPTLNFKENDIKEIKFTLDDVNKSTEIDSFQNKLIEFEEDEEEKNNLFFNKKNSTFSDDLVELKEESCEKKKNFDFTSFEYESNDKKDNKETGYENEVMDENTVYYSEIKEDINNNTLLFEDIL